jgi:hypothetical protein
MKVKSEHPDAPPVVSTQQPTPTPYGASYLSAPNLHAKELKIGHFCAFSQKWRSTTAPFTPLKVVPIRYDQSSVNACPCYPTAGSKKVPPHGPVHHFGIG